MAENEPSAQEVRPASLRPSLQSVGGFRYFDRVTDVGSGSSSADFKLSITRALADQLMVALRALHPEPLTECAVSALDTEPGIYELFLNGRRVYVGKASNSLPRRLMKHHRKISGRSNISLDDVTFQCLYVEEDLEAAAPEKMLIKRYRDEGGAPWNTNGFGNNDPGRNRDNSLVKENHFDALFPINMNLPVSMSDVAGGSVASCLKSLKDILPFNLRYEDKARSRVELSECALELSGGGATRTVAEMIHAVIGALPEGWQATAFPGYVILYRENKTYASADMTWRKSDGEVVVLAGQSGRAEPARIADEGDDPGGEE